MRTLEDYKDIIDIKRHRSFNHKEMTRLNRAAQFAPFAALTGYSEAIIETGRIVENRKELTEEESAKINERIKYALLEENKNIPVHLVIFIKDKTKDGGRYEEREVIIKKIDEVNRFITLEDRTKINIDDIYDISGEMFKIFDEVFY